MKLIGKPMIHVIINMEFKERGKTHDKRTRAFPCVLDKSTSRYHN